VLSLKTAPTWIKPCWGLFFGERNEASSRGKLLAPGISQGDMLGDRLSGPGEEVRLVVLS
jgi:hypothetical protein